MIPTVAELEAFRAGRRETLERIYWEHVDAVERLVRGGLQRAGRFTTASLEDVVQEIFAKAFSEKARASYDGEREYGPFIRQLARNALIDWLRRATKEVAGGADMAALIDGAEEDAKEAAPFDEELVRATARFVDGLEPELKRVHERRFLAGESQESAAQALGISRQNLRTLERRLLDSLRRELRNLERPARTTFSQPTTARKPY
jgi:RNA polymerase sigma factor (sigma-70 family)